MSHEIRTPMNAIIGYALCCDTKYRLAVPNSGNRRITFAADHLLAVINDILDISKIEAGKMVLERADFDLAACCARPSASSARRRATRVCP